MKTRFNDWITYRIKQSKFTEGLDYVSLTEFSVSGGTKKEYHLTMDAAKHLSMMEGNERGRMVRQYFIDFEKAARPRLSRGTLRS